MAHRTEFHGPDGRRIELPETAWDHIVNRHPEMADYLGEVLLTVEHPTHREPDLRPGRERLFRPGGPEAWIRVVIEFRGHADRVITAFPQVNDPRPKGSR